MGNWNDHKQNNNSPALRKRTVDLYKIIQLRVDKRAKYDKDTVIQAGRLYLVYGNYQRVSTELGVDRTTVRNWANKDWWPVLLEELKYLKNIELDSKYTHALEKSLSELMDRLENGDEVIDTKSGTKHRKKIGARDAALISAIMYDKRALLRGDPTQIKENNFNLNDRMDQLQGMFEKIARKSEERVIEGEAETVVEEIKGAVNLPHQQEQLDEARKDH